MTPDAAKLTIKLSYPKQECVFSFHSCNYLERNKADKRKPRLRERFALLAACLMGSELKL